MNATESVIVRIDSRMGSASTGRKSLNPAGFSIMKKVIITITLFGLVAAAYAQGYIALNNINNTNSSLTATSGGLFFFDQMFPSLNPVRIDMDFNAAFYGGTDSASLTLLHQFSGPGATADNAAGPGTFLDRLGGVYAVPGTTAASTTAFFRIEAWVGSASSFSQAGLANWASYNLIFSNPVDDIANPPNLVGMPATTILYIPEPGTLALAGLCAASLLSWRRWKQAGKR